MRVEKWLRRPEKRRERGGQRGKTKPWLEARPTEDSRLCRNVVLDQIRLLLDDVGEAEEAAKLMGEGGGGVIEGGQGMERGSGGRWRRACWGW